MNNLTNFLTQLYQYIPVEINDKIFNITKTKFKTVKEIMQALDTILILDNHEYVYMINNITLDNNLTPTIELITREFNV